MSKISWQKMIVQSGLSVVAKIAMVVIILIAALATFTGALTTAKALGFIGLPALGFAALPDALMVLSAARMRQTGLSPHQRKHAQRAMRFGLSFSVVTNMIGAFLIIAPTGSWIDNSSPRAVWLQHAMAALTIIWHAVPVVILWYATEMITRPKVEPASLKTVLSGRTKPKTVPAQRKAPRPLNAKQVPATI